LLLLWKILLDLTFSAIVACIDGCTVSVHGLHQSHAPLSLKPRCCCCIAHADAVPDHCPRVLINRERVGEGMGSMGLLGSLLGMGGGGGFTFEKDQGAYRDVLHLGDSDDGVRELCKLLGWEQELDALIDAAPDPSRAAAAAAGPAAAAARPADAGSAAVEGNSSSGSETSKKKEGAKGSAAAEGSSTSKAAGSQAEASKM
jgi:hypothetical protein